MSEVSILNRPVMTTGEAARQLRIPLRTLSQWLEGATRKGTWYLPVLREKPTGSQNMNWGELVEARYLRAYRGKSVSMQQLREFIAGLRQDFGIPYPLAHSRPFIGAGRRLVLQVQERVGLAPDMWTVYEAKSGQLILGAPASDFYERIEFGPSGEAITLHPAGRDSPVTMRPTVASGAATVRGTRTEVLAELANTGSTVDEIAEDFSLPVGDVKAALSYEWAQTA